MGKFSRKKDRMDCQKHSKNRFNEGWNGSSLRVVGNIQKRLERIIVAGAGGFGKNVQRKIGRVVKNVQRRLRRVIRRVVGNIQMKAGMGPPDGSLETSKNKG